MTFTPKESGGRPGGARRPRQPGRVGTGTRVRRGATWAEEERALAYGGVASRGAGQRELSWGGNDKWGIFFLFSIMKVISAFVEK